MAWLADTYTWAAFGAELKTYLGITGSADDVRLEGWLTSAVAAADSYVGHPWLNQEENEDYPSSITPLRIRTRYGVGIAEGGDIPPPDAVRQGLLEWCRMAWEVFGPTPRPFGLTNAKTGDLSESYAVGTRVRGGNVSLQDITDTIKPHWSRYRVDLSY